MILSEMVTTQRGIAFTHLHVTLCNVRAKWLLKSGGRCRHSTIGIGNTEKSNVPLTCGVPMARQPSGVASPSSQLLVYVLDSCTADKINALSPSPSTLPTCFPHHRIPLHLRTSPQTIFFLTIAFIERSISTQRKDQKSGHYQGFDMGLLGGFSRFLVDFEGNHAFPLHHDLQMLTTHSINRDRRCEVKSNTEFWNNWYSRCTPTLGKDCMCYMHYVWNWWARRLGLSGLTLAMKATMKGFQELESLCGIASSESKMRVTVMLVAQLVLSPSHMWHSSRIPLLQHMPFSSRTVLQHMLCASTNLPSIPQKKFHPFFESYTTIPLFQVLNPMLQIYMR